MCAGRALVNFISLDIETSSSDMRGNLISIGLVKYKQIESINKVFYAQASFPGGLFCTPKAMEINKISISSLGDECNYQSLEKIDRRVEEFLFLYPKDPGRDPLPVWTAMGRGIGYFDMQFIERDLPRTFARLSRRVFDLTGYMFGVSETIGLDFGELRERALAYATERMKPRTIEGNSYNRHHALYDAWHNVYVLEYLNGYATV